MKQEEVVTPNGEVFVCWIGTSAQENWDLIDASEPRNIWFHLDGISSAHLILKTVGPVSARTIARCASLCKQHTSKARWMKKTGVIYTEVFNLSRSEETGSVVARKTRRVVV